jgi:hypothetical protein
MTDTFPNLKYTCVGFSPLQVQALRNTFAYAGGTDEIDTLGIGKSGTAGTLRIYPTTASKGDIKIVAADNTGNTETTITNAAYGQATTLTIPDPGASTAKFVLDTGTNATATITKISTGASAVPLIDIIGSSITPAAGAANVCNVTIQLKDGAGTSIARSVLLFLWLSDSSTGDGITSTTASGTVTCTTGTDIFDHTAKKIKTIKTNSSGSAVLAITDTSKTGFYVCIGGYGQGTKVSAQLVTGNYG